MSKVTDDRRPTPDGLTVAGRQFHGITQELSAAQDHYLIGHLRRAGCLEAMTGQATPEVAAEALLTQLLCSGRAHYVLAGCLTEAERQWSAEAAESNAQFFAQARDPADKAAMREALLGFVLGFFQYATASVATSLKSSNLN